MRIRVGRMWKAWPIQPSVVAVWQCCTRNVSVDGDLTVDELKTRGWLEKRPKGDEASSGLRSRRKECLHREKNHWQRQ